MYLCWTELFELLLNFIACNSTVFDIETEYLCLTELFEIELFWHLAVCKKDYCYTKLNGLKFNSTLNGPKRVDTP